MTHTYNVTGMTCDGCSAKVRLLLKRVSDVTDVKVNREAGEVDVTMTKHVHTAILQEALKEYPKYQLTEKEHHHHAKPERNIFAEQPAQPEEDKRTWIQTYKPILIIAGYITLVSALVASINDGFNSMLFMRIFMAGFFLTFSFFKMLDLKGFASSYAMYDVVAMKIPAWGYIYAFIELVLGIAFATDFEPVITNAVTAIVMSVSLIGVLQSVLNKKKIQCACLGAVFNLPMSTVTIIEDGLMILMSVGMLTMYL
jgi:cation transport ATPase